MINNKHEINIVNIKGKAFLAEHFQKNQLIKLINFCFFTFHHLLV